MGIRSSDDVGLRHPTLDDVFSPRREMSPETEEPDRDDAESRR